MDKCLIRFKVEVETDGWAQMEMLLRQDAHMIDLSNDKLKSDLSCTMWSQVTIARPSQTDERQTDHRVRAPYEQRIAR